MAASLADGSVDTCPEGLKEIQGNKGLYCAGKAAAVDAVCTAAAKEHVTEGKGYIDRLIADTAFHCCVLEILVR